MDDIDLTDYTILIEVDRGRGRRNVRALREVTRLGTDRLLSGLRHLEALHLLERPQSRRQHWHTTKKGRERLNRGAPTTSSRRSVSARSSATHDRRPPKPHHLRDAVRTLARLAQLLGLTGDMVRRAADLVERHKPQSDNVYETLPVVNAGSSEPVTEPELHTSESWAELDIILSEEDPD